MRGIYNFLTDFPAYQNNPRFWHVTGLSWDCFWWDLIVNRPVELVPDELADTKGLITEYLSELKRQVEATLERRFVYYFVSRTKVRFDVARRPYYGFNGKLALTFLIGAKKRQFKWKMAIWDARTGKLLRPKVTLSDKFINIQWSEESSVTISVHELIRRQKLSLGIASHVHYVGITKNPHNRPINRKHRAISDVLHNISNDENDFFLFVNTFKVVTRTCEQQSKIHFFAANAMTDEISVGPEGAVIEHGLIAYFDSPFQAESNSNERATLANNLQNLRESKNIRGVLFDIEPSEPDEYNRFFSNSVPSSDRHVFMCSAEGKQLVIKRHDVEFDAEGFFFGEGIDRNR